MYIMSFGAGEEQIYGIKLAKEMGYKVVAIDGNKNSEGFKYADEYFCVDLKEKHEILKVAKAYDIKAIIPSPIGNILSNVGYLNDELGIKGISEEAALNCTDKKRLNQLLKDEIKLPKQIEAVGFNQIEKAITEIGIPCILKPKKGSGSRGVIAIFKDTDIAKSIRIHLEGSTSQESLIEEFIKGKEYGIDGVVENGRFKIIISRDKKLTELPYRQEVSYMAPSSLAKEDLDIIENYLNCICKKLKLNHCLINCDLIYENGMPILIEISGRPPGLKISEKLIEECISLNIIENAINYMVSEEYTFKGDFEKNVMLQFLDIQEGEVLEIPEENEIFNGNMVYYNSKVNVGDSLTVIRNGMDLYKRGYFILASESKAELYEESEGIKSKFKIKPGV